MDFTEIALINLYFPKYNTLSKYDNSEFDLITYSMLNQYDIKTEQWIEYKRKKDDNIFISKDINENPCLVSIKEKKGRPCVYIKKENQKLFEENYILHKNNKIIMEEFCNNLGGIKRATMYRLINKYESGKNIFM